MGLQELKAYFEDRFEHHMSTTLETAPTLRNHFLLIYERESPIQPFCERVCSRYSGVTAELRRHIKSDLDDGDSVWYMCRRLGEPYENDTSEPTEFPPKHEIPVSEDEDSEIPPYGYEAVMRIFNLPVD